MNEELYYSSKSNYASIEHDKKNSIIVEQQEFNLVSMLKPRIFIDGDKWCVLYGENIQDGIAGFGDSPIRAIYSFNEAFHTKLK